MPTSFMSGEVCAPIENSPPGIHTIPCGALPGAGAGFGTVGRKVGGASGTSGADVLLETASDDARWSTNAQRAAAPSRTARNRMPRARRRSASHPDRVVSSALDDARAFVMRSAFSRVFRPSPGTSTAIAPRHEALPGASVARAMSGTPAKTISCDYSRHDSRNTVRWPLNQYCEERQVHRADRAQQPAGPLLDTPWWSRTPCEPM